MLNDFFSNGSACRINRELFSFCFVQTSLLLHGFRIFAWNILYKFEYQLYLSYTKTCLDFFQYIWFLSWWWNDLWLANFEAVTCWICHSASQRFVSNTPHHVSQCHSDQCLRSEAFTPALRTPFPPVLHLCFLLPLLTPSFLRVLFIKAESHYGLLQPSLPFL